MLSKFNPAACENLLPWRKSIHLIFLGEKTDSGTKTGFHGNLRHCNCSLPQSHSLLCAGSGSPSDPLSHFNKLRRQKNIHFFRLVHFFCLCALKWQFKCSRGQERTAGTGRKARTTTSCSQVCSAREPAACVLDSNHLKLLFGSFLCPAVMYHHVGWNTLVYEERYSKRPWELLLQRLCSKLLGLVLLAYMFRLHENKIIVYKGNTLWIHTGKGFGIPAFNSSKKYYLKSMLTY